jgi:hypothetical protein
MEIPQGASNVIDAKPPQSQKQDLGIVRTDEGIQIDGSW